MMKKTLLLASLLAFTVSIPCFAADAATTPSETPKKAECCEKQAPPEFHRPPKGPDCKCKKEDKKAEFEKRLNLTDEQKAQAKAIREKGHQEMKPVMEKIKVKRDEIKAIKESEDAVEVKQEKIDKLRTEIRELNKSAHDLRMKNMKEFESILTAKQLKELQKMKEEGRKKFDKEFRKKHGDGLRPPFPPEFGRHPAGGPDFPPPPSKAEEK